MSSLTKYKYSPLSAESKEVRLLTLLPGEFTDELIVQLHNAALLPRSELEYEALSYTWGSPDNPSSIKVDSNGGYHAISVSRNLAIALPYLRYLNKPRVLWIDAVCINQEDVVERGQQVQRMGDIYFLATRVVIWLGPEEQDSTFALDLMQTLSSKVEVDWESYSMKPSENSQSDPRWADNTAILPYGKHEIQALYHLLSRSWFERLWIWQEIRLAKPSSIVVCGFAVGPLHHFRNAIFCLNNKRSEYRMEGLMDRLDMIFDLVDINVDDLGATLSKTNGRKCADDRDRIYALLSTVASSRLEIVPDYMITVEQLYQDVMLRHIESFNNLDMLLLCQMHEKQQYKVPTWVPDWSIVTQVTPLHRKSAGASSRAYAKYLGEGILEATGVQCGTILDSQKLLVEQSSLHGLISIIIELALKGLGEDYSEGNRKSTMLNAFCRTVCAGNIKDQYSPNFDYLPDIATCEAAIHKFVTEGPPPAAEWPPKDPDIDLLLRTVRSQFKGRTFFWTSHNRMGLGPELSRPGDVIYALLGARSLLVLRPCEFRRYQVVGECYVHGLMNGEAFLGPLPSKYWPITHFDFATDFSRVVYADNSTGDILYDDPRLSDSQSSGNCDIRKVTNLSEMRVSEEWMDERITPEMLVERSLTVEKLQLI